MCDDRLPAPTDDKTAIGRIYEAFRPYLLFVAGIAAVCAWLGVITEPAAMTANATAPGRFDPIFPIRVPPRQLCFFSPCHRRTQAAGSLPLLLLMSSLAARTACKSTGKVCFKTLAPGAGEGVPKSLHFPVCHAGMAPDE